MTIFNTSANFTNIQTVLDDSAHNVALASTPTASSQYSSTYSPAKLIDGLNTTYWHSSGSPTPHYCQFQLTSAAYVSMIALTSSSADLNYRLQQFNFYGSNNGTDWDLLLSASTGFTTAGNQRVTFQIDNVSTAYQYYKIQDTAAQAYIALGEVELFAYRFFLVNDTDKLYLSASPGYEWNNASFSHTITASDVHYQYADYAEAQDWITAADVNANAAWNGTWLTLAQLKAEANTNKPFRYLKVRVLDYGSYTSLEADKIKTDLTPPTGVSGVANIALGTTAFDLVTTCDNGTDTGGSGFAGTNFEIEVNGVSYFQQSDGSFSASEIFGNLLLKGEASEHILVYALQQAALPNRFRLNSWDYALNVARGDWHTFSQPIDMDYVLSSEGGNYDDTYLIPANVKKDITYGVDETGTYDPSGEPPSQPTIHITDSGDGSHAVATISGSDTGTTNNIYTAKYGTTAWTLSGTRTGNGTVTLTLDNGSYWAYCDSSLESCSSRSITAIVHIANLDEAVIVDIAEYIKDEINNSDISDVAERNYIQHERLEKITGTEIWVQPNEHRIERATRTKDQHEYDIDVSLFKRCMTTAETDDLVLLSEEIYQFLRSLEINGSLPSVVTMPTMFSPDDLLERNLFASVITVTVKGIS